MNSTLTVQAIQSIKKKEKITDSHGHCIKRTSMENQPHMFQTFMKKWTAYKNEQMPTSKSQVSEIQMNLTLLYTHYSASLCQGI